jgi:hypothetical protein
MVWFLGIAARAGDEEPLPSPDEEEEEGSP